jgi:hypothetical protein
MNENLDNAKEELKRADHLIFVSLKYTRTCDVIKHIIDRLINTIDFTFTALLEDLKEKNKIKEVPNAPIPKANLVKSLFKDDALIQDFSSLFILLRKISKANFSRSCEFRRHVTMTVVVDDETFAIDIDKITEYFKKTKELFAHVSELLGADDKY